MAKTPTEHFRTHGVWDVLTLKRDALSTSRFGRADLEIGRNRVIYLLDRALASFANPQPYLFDGILDELQSAANQIPSDENGFARFVGQFEPQLTSLTRQLPGPPPRNIPHKYAQVLDELVDARKAESEQLAQRTAHVSEQLSETEKAASRISTQLRSESTRVTDASTRLEAVVEEAAERMDRDWASRLQDWTHEREQRDSALDAQVADKIALLTVAAQVGQRLVEHAAGTQTALEWTRRATRERRSGLLMRLLAVLFFGAAVVIGGYIVSRAIDDGFTMTLGDGLLRTGVVLSVAGVGAYLATESPRDSWRA